MYVCVGTPHADELGEGRGLECNYKKSGNQAKIYFSKAFKAKIEFIDFQFLGLFNSVVQEFLGRNLLQTVNCVVVTSVCITVAIPKMRRHGSQLFHTLKNK